MSKADGNRKESNPDDSTIRSLLYLQTAALVSVELHLSVKHITHNYQ